MTTLESFNHDGMVIARRRKHRRSLPIRQIMLFLIAVTAFKLVLFFDMGAAAYGAKATELMASDNVVEHWAGRAMQLDPASQYFVDQLRFARW